MLPTGILENKPGSRAGRSPPLLPPNPPAHPGRRGRVKALVCSCRGLCSAWIWAVDERRPMNFSSQLTCCGSEGGLRVRALRDPTAPGAAPPPTDRALADPGEGLFLTSARFLVPFPVLISGAKLGAGASSERGRAWGKRGACPRNRVCAKPPLSPAWGHTSPPWRSCRLLRGPHHKAGAQRSNAKMREDTYQGPARRAVSGRGVQGRGGGVRGRRD